MRGTQKYFGAILKRPPFDKLRTGSGAEDAEGGAEKK